MAKAKSPEITINRNPGYWRSRLLIGTPATGLVRMEWVMGRYGQTLPTNWSHTECIQFMSSYIPVEYQVADAQNIIVKWFIDQRAEWFFSLEQDNVLPADYFVKLNQYMISGDVPIVSGLYFTKSEPPEPMVYRKFGNGYFSKFKLGEKVWTIAVPMGCTLIHGSILKSLWDCSPEYVVGNTVTRRVFNTPAETVNNPETGGLILTGGTSDFAFCRRVVDEKIFAKAGWGEYATKEFPFLVDTSLGLVRHIDNSGVQWPLRIPDELLPTEPAKKNGRNGSR